MAQYGRTINKTEGFFGTYFFNYDQNDPYRGNDLGEMGNFVGTHLLMYPSCDPYRGDCMGCGYYCPAPVYNSPQCCGPR